MTTGAGARVPRRWLGGRRVTLWGPVVLAILLALTVPSPLALRAGSSPPRAAGFYADARSASGSLPLVPSSWAQWNITNPTARGWEAMAYDPVDGYVVMFGGNQVWPPGELPGPISAGVAHPDWEGPFDPINDTWIYRNQTWTEFCTGSLAAPSCPVSPAAGSAVMTYDPLAGAMLLVDSSGRSWWFRGGAWEALNLTVHPTICPEDYDFSECPGFAAMTYDPQSRQVLLLDADQDTWTFTDGNWTETATAAHSPFETGCPGENDLFFDTTLQSVVMLCGSDGNKLYQYSGTSWSALTVTGGDDAAVSAADYDPALGGEVVLYDSDPTHSGQTWLLRDDVWTNVSAGLVQEPPYGEYRMMAYDPTDSYSVLLDGGVFEGTYFNDPQGSYENATWSLRDELGAVAWESSTRVDVGQPIQFNWSVVGGTAPYAFKVTGVPPGCAVPTIAGLETCGPVRPGDYQLVLSATDSLGEFAIAPSLELLVGPRFVVSAWANPGVTTAGFPTAFTATIAGGLPPYQASWVFEDGDRSSATTVVQEFATPGEDNATFFANDSAGMEESVQIPIEVQGEVQAAASTNVSTTDVGALVSFVDRSSGGTPPYSATWDFGDGGVGTGLETSHAYSYPGTFAVEEYVTDSVGDVAQRNLTVLVNPDPVLVMGVSTTDPAPGYAIECALTVNGGTAPYAFNWSLGNGVAGNISTPLDSTEISPDYSAPGNYTILGNVTDALGVRSATSLRVEVIGTHLVPPSARPATPVAPAGSARPSSSLWASLGLTLVALGAIAVSWAIFRRRSRPPRRPLAARPPRGVAPGPSPRR